MRLIATLGEAPAGFHGEGIRSIAFDPAGRWLLVGSNAALSLWTVSSLERVATLCRGQFHGEVSFAGELAVALVDSQLRFWRVPSGEPADEIDTAATGVARDRIAFSPAGLAAIGGEEIAVWDLATRDVRMRVPAPPAEGAPSLALSADGRRLLVSGAELRELWDVASGTRLAQVARGQRDGLALLSAGGSNALVVRRVDAAGNPTSGPQSFTVLDEISLERSGALVRRLVRGGRNIGVNSVAVSDGTGRVAASVNSGLSVWAPGEAPRTIDRVGEHRVFGRCNAIAFSPDASVIATGDSDGWITRWNARTLERLDEKPEVVRGRATQPDGSVLAVTAVAASRDGRRVLAVDERGAGVCWDFAAGTAAGRGAVGTRVMGAASAGLAAFATLHDAREERPPHAGGFVCRLWSHALAQSPSGTSRTAAATRPTSSSTRPACAASRGSRGRAW